MKIRITCTEEEKAQALECLGEGFELMEISDFYPNRGKSKFGRVYIECDIKGKPTTCNNSTEEEIEKENGYQILRDCGVPFLDEETPLGVG